MAIDDENSNSQNETPDNSTGGAIDRDNLNELEDNIGSLANQGDSLKNEGLYNPGAIGKSKNALISKLGSKISSNPKRAAAIFGAGGGALIVGLFMFSLLAGPFQLLHLAQMLSQIHFGDADVVSSQRLRNLMIYSKWAAGKEGAGVEKTRLGLIEAHRAGRIDEALAKSGLTSTFDKNGKFTGLKIDQGNIPEDVRKELKGLNSKTDPDGLKRKGVYAKHFEVSAQNIDIVDGKVSIKVEGTRNNRKLYSKALKISGQYNRVTAAHNRRVLIKRANLSYNPVTRIREGLKQATVSKLDEFRENRRQRLQGDAPDTQLADPKKNTADPDNPDTNPKAETVNAGKQEAVDELKAVKNGTTSKVKLTSKLAGGTALFVLTTFCTVREVSSGISDQQLANKTEVARQVASEVHAASSKSQDGGDVDTQAIGEITKSLKSKNPPANATEAQLSSGEYSKVPGSAFSASTIAKEQGRATGDRTLDKAPELNPDEKSNAQNLSAIFDSISSVWGLGASLNVACGAINTAGTVTSKLFEWATLGASKKIEDATIGKLADAAFNYLAGDVADLSAVKYAGIVFGEEASIGSRLMQNETNLALGEPLLSEDQAVALANYSKEYEAYTDDRTIAERIFNIEDYDSLAGKFASTIYEKPVLSNITQIPSATMSGIASILGMKAMAADEPVTYSDYYNIPKVGLPPGLLEDSRLENPYDNAVKAKQAIDSDSKLKEYVEKCNGITITDNLDFVSKSYADGVVDGYLKKDSACKDDKFAMYVLPESVAYYTPIQNTNSLGYRISSIFNKPTIAAPATTTLSGAQLAYARVVMAAVDTQTLKSFSCVYYDDSQGCDEISPSSSSGSAAISNTPGFKIMTFNLNSAGFDDDNKKDDNPSSLPWAERKSAVKSIVNKYDPDIFGAQEVWRDDMYDDVIGMFPNYATTSGGKQTKRNPILFKPDLFTLIKDGSFHLDGEASKDSTWAVLEHTTKAGKVLVVNAHLAHGDGNDAVRLSQAKEIRDRIKEINKNDNLPVILLGDFNEVSEKDASPVGIFKKASFINTEDVSSDKINADYGSVNHYEKIYRPGNNIDFILIQDPKAEISVNGYEVGIDASESLLASKPKTITAKDLATGVFASDHNPVIASLIFSGTDSTGIPTYGTGSGQFNDGPAINGGQAAADKAKELASRPEPKCSELIPNHPTCLNQCIVIVKRIWKQVDPRPWTSSDGSAYDNYLRAKNAGKVHDGADKNTVPVGAIMWSRRKPPRAPGPGHAYLYVGDGLVASNDISADGKYTEGTYNIVAQDTLMSQYGHEYLGWTDPNQL